MGKLKDLVGDLVRRISKKSEEDKYEDQSNNEQIKRNYVEEMYTFSSIFPTEELMNRCMKTIHESEKCNIHEDNQER